MRSEGDGNRDRARPHRDGERKRIERGFKDFVFWGGRRVCLSGVLVQEGPSRSGGHQASTNLYCVDLNTEECENMDAPQQRAEQKKETVDTDFLRQQPLRGERDGPHSIHENGGAAQRINDGEEGGDDQDSSLDDRSYFVTNIRHQRDSPAR